MTAALPLCCGSSGSSCCVAWLALLAARCCFAAARRGQQQLDRCALDSRRTPPTTQQRRWRRWRTWLAHAVCSCHVPQLQNAPPPPPQHPTSDEGHSWRRRASSQHHGTGIVDGILCILCRCRCVQRRRTPSILRVGACGLLFCVQGNFGRGLGGRRRAWRTLEPVCRDIIGKVGESGVLFENIWIISPRTDDHTD